MRHSNFAAFIVVIAAIFALTGCLKEPQRANILYSNKALKIECEGAQTRIYDIKGKETYTFTSHRQKVKKDRVQRVKQAQETADTDTINIQTVHSLIIVTTKTDNKTLYVKSRG